MILYNVTVAIEKTVEEDWKVWMRDIHIPEVMATGAFVEYKFFKVMREEEDSSSYSIQYFAENHSKLQTYLGQHAPGLQQKAGEAFPGKFAAFRTLLQAVE
ncbi:uncharacterized protein DUF4286 [Roseivirga ehrenbergii]|uniref:DUF4286 domain-containing protein n=1 Tax=Roseivirga ehrenbergii (strain DSM 102268 / JCM 13514 / KCTC 12282 / NCIMB 14502 / KMM 6017) TaxID=279360 RepID=A0A150XRY5_ROSEK|nr:DUF4286 family protein [Roseivirga ehrenbergii]KYG81395.1 hypothetical protein MB14_12420 [Roseivirga ehrenbergii]TCL10539.1 uncharacterized protein DUF4286 [Roseivirga ehrenbergii]